MGLANRHYMEGGFQPSQSQSFRDWSAVKTLIVINVVVFILQVFMKGRIEQWFALSTNTVLQGQIWRLTTYDFLHDTSSDFPWHLLFNMFLLWMAGREVERFLGKREFLCFYLLSGIFSGIFYLAWGILLGKPVAAIGASGAAVAVMIAYAVYWPHVRWLIWGILPVPVYLLAGLTVILDVYPMLKELSGEELRSNIAHAAHVGGILIGFFYARNRWKFSPFIFPSERRSTKGRSRKTRNFFKPGPSLKVHRPQSEEIQQSGASQFRTKEMEERLDQLLEKITREGEASLTSEEREFLTEASRRLRERSQ